jgi:hypothetical protein
MFLPRWEIVIIETVGASERDVNDSRRKITQKQYGSVIVMLYVLDAYDHDTCVDAQCRPECENFVTNEYHSLMKNQTWDLVQ